MTKAAAEEGSHRTLHAFPGVDNAASNALCRKAGFTLLEAREFEYPKGHWMRCNDWSLGLCAASGEHVAAFPLPQYQPVSCQPHP